MADEIYDVVDESGDKVGTSTWSQVHAERLLHQVVHGLLFSDSSRKKVLIKKRASTAYQEPGKYEVSVAGHVLTNNTPEETIRKELSEELFGNKSLPPNIKINKITTYLHQDLPLNREVASLYEIICPGPFVVDKESSELKWMNWDQLGIEIKKSPENWAVYAITAIENYIRSSRSQ